jgi:uncharacterized protein with HEPN domain
MRPEERGSAYLLNIVLATPSAIDYLGDRSTHNLEQDQVIPSEIQYHLIVLGEAARRVSEATKQEHPELAWGRAFGMRNVLVHECGRADVGEIIRGV